MCEKEATQIAETPSVHRKDSQLLPDYRGSLNNNTALYKIHFDGVCLLHRRAVLK
jgi:hypothetical protein